MIRRRILFLIIGAIAAIAAYSSYYVLASVPQPMPDNIPENPITTSRDVLSTKGIRGDLELSLALPKRSYISGESLSVNMSLSNTGKGDITVHSGQTLLEVFLTSTDENSTTLSSKADLGNGCLPPGETEQSRTTVIGPGEAYEFTFELEVPKVNSTSEFLVQGLSLGVVDPWDPVKYGHVNNIHCPTLLRTDLLPIEVLVR